MYPVNLSSTKKKQQFLLCLNKLLQEWSDFYLQISGAYHFYWFPLYHCFNTFACNGIKFFSFGNVNFVFFYFIDYTDSNRMLRCLFQSTRQPQYFIFWKFSINSLKSGYTKTPVVNVPVLSNRSAVIFSDSFKAVLLRINKPFCADTAVEMATTSGIAKPMHGDRQLPLPLPYALMQIQMDILLSAKQPMFQNLPIKQYK